MVPPGALHSAIWMDLKVEAGPAVELPPPQNPLQMAEVRQASGQPLRGHQVVMLLPLHPHHQSGYRVVVHRPSRGENEMRTNGCRSGTRGTKAVQKSVGEAPNLGRCPHHRYTRSGLHYRRDPTDEQRASVRVKINPRSGEREKLDGENPQWVRNHQHRWLDCHQTDIKLRGVFMFARIPGSSYACPFSSFLLLFIPFSSPPYAPLSLLFTSGYSPLL